MPYDLHNPVSIAGARGELGLKHVAARQKECSGVCGTKEKG